MALPKRISEVINEMYPFMFVTVCKHPFNHLEDDQWYVQMVTDNEHGHNSPHVKFYDPYTNTYLVGVERVSSKSHKQWYISKKFHKRNFRGIVVLVKIEEKDLNDCYILE